MFFFGKLEFFSSDIFSQQSPFPSRPPMQVKFLQSLYDCSQNHFDTNSCESHLLMLWWIFLLLEASFCLKHSAPEPDLLGHKSSSLVEFLVLQYSVIYLKSFGHFFWNPWLELHATTFFLWSSQTPGCHDDATLISSNKNMSPPSPPPVKGFNKTGSTWHSLRRL